MDPKLVKEVLLSPLGFLLGVLIKAFIASLLVCAGINLFRFKNVYFEMRQVLAIWIIIIALRLAVLAIFSQFEGGQ